MVLRVGRIDGDERNVAPILAAGQIGRLCCLRLGQRLAAEHVRDAVRMDRDLAHGAFGLDRTEPLLDAAGREAEAACLRDVDGDQIAVLGVAGRARRDRELAPDLFLLDRRQPAAAARKAAEDAERALLSAVDDLDHAPAVADIVVRLTGLLDPDQRTVVDAGGLAGLRAARRLRCGFSAAPRAPPRPIRSAPRSVRRRLAARDLGQHDRGEGAGAAQLAAAALDLAVVGKFAQHVLQGDRSVFLRPKARAISRVPTLPGREAMKARTSCLEGRDAACRAVWSNVQVRGVGVVPQ